MGWGCIRIGIVSIAFFVGLMLGPIGTTAGSKSPDVPRVNGHIGTSVVVACDGGDVAIKHVGGKVQLDCVQGKIVVVRGENNKARRFTLIAEVRGR